MEMCMHKDMKLRGNSRSFSLMCNHYHKVYNVETQLDNRLHLHHVTSIELTVKITAFKGNDIRWAEEPPLAFLRLTRIAEIHIYSRLVTILKAFLH